MNILIIDRDQLSAQMLGSKLEHLGHTVTTESVKQNAVDRMAEQKFDIIFTDPSPMKDARALVLNMRRKIIHNPYLVLLTADEDISMTKVLQMGCNDFLIKPIDQQDLDTKLQNANHLLQFFAQIGDARLDFPSAGGIISKSAFYQLCLSAMERGGRYNERAFVLTFSLDNYADMLAHDGQHVAEMAASNMIRHIVRLRRQSDIIGQIQKHQLAILLQRADQDEAQGAINRFISLFDIIGDLVPEGAAAVSLNFSLLHLPTGAVILNHTSTKSLRVN